MSEVKPTDKPTEEKLQEAYGKTMALYDALRDERMAYNAHEAGHTDVNCEALKAARVRVFDMIVAEPCANAIMIFGFRCGREHASECQGCVPAGVN